MGILINVIVSLCSLFPVWFVIVILGSIALVLIFIIVKIVGFVLDALPFL